MQPKRTLVPAALILSMLLPAAAFAGPRGGQGRSGGYAHGRHAQQEGFVTVRNQNNAELEVLVDGKVRGTVGPLSADRFGPFREGKHKVRVRFVGRNLRFPVTVQSVYIDGQRPARVHAPEMDAGIVRVNNRWVEPMTVVLNGRSIGRVGGNSKNVFKVRDARGRLELRTPAGTTVASRHLNLRGLERDRVVVDAPSHGEVTVFNPSRRHELDIVCSRGSLLARVAPNGRATIVQPAGHVRLTATYRNQPIQTATVLASPFDRSPWTVALPTQSTLAVRNPNRFPVSVFLAGQFVATVQGNDKLMLEGMPVGRVTVEVNGQGRRGGLAEQLTTRVDPLSGGFLAIPEARFSDGRGGSYGGSAYGSAGTSCDTEQPTQTAGRRGRSSGGYASNRR